MEEKLKSAIERYQKAPTSLEAYKAISDFVELVLAVSEFIKQVEEEGEKIRIAQAELNADKGWNYGLRGRDLDEHNKRRDKKYEALFQLDPWFPLHNLRLIQVGIQPENIVSNSDWLFHRFGPDDPLPKADREEYQLFMDKLYKKILPFLKAETKEESLEEIKVKAYDEEKRTLIIGSYQVIIAKNEGNNNAHEIMAYIFIDKKDDLTAKFYYADIADERFKASYNSKNKQAYQSYSGACERINDKVKDATNGQVKKFLIFNHSVLGFVQVNPKYL